MARIDSASFAIVGSMLSFAQLQRQLLDRSETVPRSCAGHARSPPNVIVPAS